MGSLGQGWAGESLTKGGFCPPACQALQLSQEYQPHGKTLSWSTGFLPVTSQIPQPRGGCLQVCSLLELTK